MEDGGPRVVVSTAAFHARARGSVPGLGGLKETKMFLPHPRVKVSIVGSLRDREVACSASDRQGPNFESCVWRTVSSQSSHHPQELFLAQFSLYVHKGGLKPDSFHFVSTAKNVEFRGLYPIPNCGWYEDVCRQWSGDVYIHDSPWQFTLQWPAHANHQSVTWPVEGQMRKWYNEWAGPSAHSLYRPDLQEQMKGRPPFIQGQHERLTIN